MKQEIRRWGEQCHSKSCVHVRLVPNEIHNKKCRRMSNFFYLKSLGELAKPYPKIVGSSEDEPTLSFLYCVDAVIAHAIDSFKLAADETGDWDIERNGCIVKVHDEDAERAGEIIKPYLKCETLP